MSGCISGASQSSSSQMLSNIFSKIDTKKQGYIDKSELQQAFSGISDQSSTGSSTDELFKKLDGDGDGKITQTELSSGMQSLVDALRTQFQQSGMGDVPPQGDDQGLSKDQLTSISQDSSTSSDAKSKISNLLANFDAADTNKDGKISMQEAMAFDKSSKTSSTKATDSSDASSSLVDSVKLMAQLMNLIQAYGGSDSSSTSSTSSVSATA